MHVHVNQFTPLKTIYYVYRVCSIFALFTQSSQRPNTNINRGRGCLYFVCVGGGVFFGGDCSFFVFLNWGFFFLHSFHFFSFLFIKFHCIERIEMKRKVDKLGIVHKNTSLNRKKQFPCPKLSHNNNSFHDLVPTKATQNKQESLIFTRRSQYLLRHLDINLHRTQCRQIFSIFTSCGNPVFYMSVLQ